MERGNAPVQELTSGASGRIIPVFKGLRRGVLSREAIIPPPWAKLAVDKGFGCGESSVLASPEAEGRRLEEERRGR
ncbi:hypothetical protein HPP92_002858 [Vanilla planifolia]|uniref:Uncharacterized protein n=1 Tax=Vanilla planifolia TaxID=51239 RepID=A0A835S751_VANPL|nr:hypothetical protein HPP92_002858 [Vanilla planifolia]